MPPAPWFSAHAQVSGPCAAAVHSVIAIEASPAAHKGRGGVRILGRTFAHPKLNEDAGLMASHVELVVARDGLLILHPCRAFGWGSLPATVSIALRAASCKPLGQGGAGL